MSDDPFEPLGKSAKPHLRVVASAADLQNIVPIPADAPPPPTHPNGAPTATWIYRDSAGRELGRVLRFDRDGQKEFRPLTLWRKGAESATWWWKSWSDPRPIYGLDRLAARPAAPVVVAEGEKAADAAQRLLPGHVVVTSPGGSNAGAKADWRPLAGRRVVIWPDADAAGLKYAQAVAGILEGVGAASVAIVTPPPGVVAGWDAADGEAQGWSTTQADDLVRSATPAGRKSPRASSAKGDGRDKTEARPARGVDAIIKLVESEGVEFWHDPAKNAFATVRVAGHRENHPVENRAFSEWIARVAYKAGVTPPNSNTLKESLLLFGARARYEGAEKTPIRRSGQRQGKLYLDLCDDFWRVVEIDASGWRILTDHDVPVIRSASMRPLIEPEPAASLGDLFRFLNANDDGKKLVVAWMLMALAGAGPFPILIFNGEEGSAKSTMSALVRNMIDANVAPIRSLPRDERDLLVGALHSHVMCFDNVSNIDGETSDRLCRIATGGGLSARTLHTNNEESVIFVRNPLILNGIPSLANRPDLASRSLLIRLNAIPETQRMTEREFQDEWNKAASGVLGVLLDALSCALRRLPDTRLSRSGRMADFEQFVEAASPALEWRPGEFSEVLRRSRVNTDAVLIAENDVTVALTAFINEEPSHKWEGTASVLLERLNSKVSETTRRGRGWPASPTALGKHLSRFTTLLRRNGVTVERGHSGGRWWKIAGEYKDDAEQGSSEHVE